jgi:hypothetical protein
MYLLTFFSSICYQLAKKTRKLLFAIQLHAYFCFVGFIANLLNRPIVGATVGIRKRAIFRPLVSTYVKLPKFFSFPFTYFVFFLRIQFFLNSTMYHLASFSFMFLPRMFLPFLDLYLLSDYHFHFFFASIFHIFLNCFSFIAQQISTNNFRLEHF